MTRCPVAMSRRAPRWLEWAQDLAALACMLAGFGGLTLLCVGLVGP